MADDARYVEVQPAAIAGGSQEVTGILLCLSCHDGNLTPENMMQNWSYEHQMGLLAETPYRDQKTLTLLEELQTPAREHPIGMSALITPGSGLVWSNGAFSVIPKSPYAQFVANYGWPSLAPQRRSSSYGVTNSGEPYALCTTCHDQHVRSVYASGASSPIAGDGGGKFYATFFFVNGPYNPKVDKLANQDATSSAQFCRQCHFNDANEGNNSNHVPTAFF